MPQPLRLSAQQEQDELVKFSGCTMSAETGPRTVPLVQDMEMPAAALARTDLLPVPTTLSRPWLLSLQAGGFVN